MCVPPTLPSALRGGGENLNLAHLPIPPQPAPVCQRPTTLSTCHRGSTTIPAQVVPEQRRIVWQTDDAGRHTDDADRQQRSPVWQTDGPYRHPDDAVWQPSDADRQMDDTDRQPRSADACADGGVSGLAGGGGGGGMPESRAFRSGAHERRKFSSRRSGRTIPFFPPTAPPRQQGTRPSLKAGLTGGRATRITRPWSGHPPPT